jgi:hypothetical protein
MSNKLIYRVSKTPPVPPTAVPGPAEKGAPLTYAEMDYNWWILANDKVDKEAGKGLSKNDFTDALKNKLEGVAAGATAYTHPTGDGNLHVPATGSGNNGKVLKAGPTPGSLSWGNLDAAAVGLGNVANKSEADLVAGGPIKTALDGKSNIAHTHSVSQVAGLGTAAVENVGTTPASIPTVSTVQQMITNSTPYGKTISGTFIMTKANNFIGGVPNFVEQIVPGGLEVGDVIEIYIPSTGYKKLHTVSYVAGSNPGESWAAGVTVNANHVPAPGTSHTRGPLVLPINAPGGVSATVKFISKWYNASVGVGQGWVDFRPTTSTGAAPVPLANPEYRLFSVAASGYIVQYQNVTNRSIMVSFSVSDAVSGSAPPSVTAYVDGFIATHLWDVWNGAHSYSIIVPPGSTYWIDRGRNTHHAWLELR